MLRRTSTHGHAPRGGTEGDRKPAGRAQTHRRGDTAGRPQAWSGRGHPEGRTDCRMRAPSRGAKPGSRGLCGRAGRRVTEREQVTVWKSKHGLRETVRWRRRGPCAPGALATGLPWAGPTLLGSRLSVSGTHLTCPFAQGRDEAPVLGSGRAQGLLPSHKAGSTQGQRGRCHPLSPLPTQVLTHGSPGPTPRQPRALQVGVPSHSQPSPPTSPHLWVPTTRCVSVTGEGGRLPHLRQGLRDAATELLRQLEAVPEASCAQHRRVRCENGGSERRRPFRAAHAHCPQAVGRGSSHGIGNLIKLQTLPRSLENSLPLSFFFFFGCKR